VGATAPCKRCRQPYVRRRGRRFCTDCTGTRGPSSRHVPEDVTRAAERGEPMTDTEIAVALGLTRQRVNMILQSALAKLRSALGPDAEDWI